MESDSILHFRTLSENVGPFSLRNKTFLIPEMNRVGCHLMAATFRAFGIDARLLDTYQGLDLGREFTSGKECFPCQITLGDILRFMRDEKDRLGDGFDADKYIYFMPEATGPCRFGMYNKYQRIVLDSFPELRGLKIGSLTTGDSYAVEGMLEPEVAADFRKTAYLSVVVSDVLDRLLWRVRPYERETDAADAFIEKATEVLAASFEAHGGGRATEPILADLEGVVEEGAALVDPGIPPKPRIGIVGEIYLRTHVHANQDVVRTLETYGAEVVNASIAEWINFTTYENLRNAKVRLGLSVKRLEYRKILSCLREVLGCAGTLRYQELRQDQVYRRVRRRMDLPADHRVGHLEGILKQEGHFSFDVGTEACLSIPGILEYVQEGYNGVVNVYPFTCMPSTVTSAIVRPLMSRMKVPFLDSPYDGTYQPGRESAIRTFMYQAQQHFKRNGRRETEGA